MFEKKVILHFCYISSDFPYSLCFFFLDEHLDYKSHLSMWLVRCGLVKYGGKNACLLKAWAVKFVYV